MATKTTENKDNSPVKDSSATAETAASASKKNIQADNASVNENEMKNSPLHKFFVSALKDIYFAENAIIDALDKMQEAATTEELKEAFEDHQFQTKKHVSRLEKVFKLIDETPEKKNARQLKESSKKERKL